MKTKEERVVKKVRRRSRKTVVMDRIIADAAKEPAKYIQRFVAGRGGE